MWPEGGVGGGVGGVGGGDREILGSNARRRALAGDFEARFDVGDGVEVDGMVAARPVDLLALSRQFVALGLDGLLRVVAGNPPKRGDGSDLVPRSIPDRHTVSGFDTHASGA